MKKLLLILALVILAVTVAPHAFAQTSPSGFTALAPIPGLTDSGSTSVVNETNLANFFNNLYKYLIGLAAALAVIEIIWGGLEISTKDSVSEHSDGKKRIYEALTGLVLVLAPVIVFSIINPSILNLSLNLPALDTRTSTPVPSVTSGSQATDPVAAAATNAGCTVTGTLLKKASCPTQKDAEDFASNCPGAYGHLPWVNTAPYAASCGSESGPYSFADTSSGFFAKFLYSIYEPITSTPSNPNNGSAVVQFASSCTADGGTTCLSATKLPCASKIISLLVQGSPSISCWNMTISCSEGRPGIVGAGNTCTTEPKFTPVQTQ